MPLANPQNIVPSSATSELDVVKTLSTLEQKAIVRPNNPPYGVAGFIFDIVLDDEVNLTSDITDHYIENNTAIQDQIALRPETITLRGVVAELVKRTPPPNTASRTTNPLPQVAELTPEFTLGAAQALVDLAVQERERARAAVASQSLYNLYQNRAATQPNQTRQSSAFLYFRSLWKSRELFTVETPWGYFTSMAIESLRVFQDETTKYATEFTITFKKIRVARDITVEVGQLAGRNAPQRAASQPSQNGNVGQQAATNQQTQSWLYKWTHPNP